MLEESSPLNGARVKICIPYLAARASLSNPDDAAELASAAEFAAEPGAEPAADVSAVSVPAPAAQPFAVRITSTSSAASAATAPIDLDSFRLQPRGPAASAQASFGLPDEYGADWNSILAYDIRVEVVSASDIGKPEYRVGDIMSSLLGTGELCAYVEVELGARKQKTSVGAACGRDVEFAGEKTVFNFSGEPAIAVTLFDRRNVQAMLRRDPMIGEGLLELPSDLRDCRQRMDVVDIARDGKSTGSVQLRYQMLAHSNEAVVGSAVA